MWFSWPTSCPLAYRPFAVMAASFATFLFLTDLARADDSCTRANDRSCDELVRCALDTDSSDCTVACAAAPTPPNLAGVCAHYAAVAAAAPSEVSAVDTGSHGSGGLGGMYVGEVTAGGGPGLAPTSRHYTVYVPPSYDPRVPTPLLYVFGGFTADMYLIVAPTQLMRTADANGFIVAFMQPKYELFTSLSFYVFAWDIYNVDWAANPDLAYVRAVTERLKQQYNIDRTRIFASGHSRGAALSTMLAFKLRDLIAGFYSACGFTHVDGPTGAPPRLAFDQEIAQHTGRRVPGVLLHGRQDPDVKFASSELTAQTLSANGWTEGEDFLFLRLDSVGHEWQPQYNQQIWDFLSARPLPLEEAAP